MPVNARRDGRMNALCDIRYLILAVLDMYLLKNKNTNHLAG